MIDTGHLIQESDPSPSPLSQADVLAIRDLYYRGMCLQALARARQFGPMEHWTDTDACLIGGRLAVNLGAPRLCRRLHFRAYRHNQNCAEAQYYYGLSLFELRGPLAVWNFLKRLPDDPSASKRTRSDLFTLRARAAGMLRDFNTAERWLTRADELCPDEPWNAVERAHLLEHQDRYEEALAAARRSLELHKYPWYRPGVQSTAHLLQLLDRDQEALDLLAQAADAIENAPVLLQLGALQVELTQYEAARQTYENYLHVAALLEEDGRKWLDVQRCRVAYFCGDFAGAADFARAVDDEFHKTLAERLSQPSPATRRIQLPVHFVRQHYKTCAPATIAAIGRFWKMPADHLALVQEICYDGTPAHRQREWAENNGWAVREFTITWDAAVALIDRGLPFTITTVETANAHLQAVIGYDAMRKTLLLRDPYERYASEAIAEPFLERFRATGPHAMVLVPREHAALLENLELPEAATYDQLYRLEKALEYHDRASAVAALQCLQAEAPDHRLTLQARRSLAVYDANNAEILLCVEALLRLFPNDANLRLAKLSCLRESLRADRLTYLEQITSSKEADPLFWQQYGYELSADAREIPRALRMLRRALRYRPVDANSFAITADILWARREFESATELYRFSACLEEKREQHARAFFSSSRHLKQTDIALAWLRDRFERFGAFSPQPAITLFSALCQLEKAPEGFEALESALRHRPNDGELLLFTADVYARWGKDGNELLVRAQQRAPKAAWLRTAAHLADFRGERAETLRLWREVLASEPLALDAHRAVAQAIAESEGTTAAIGHLKEVCSRFPHHFALHQLWLDWLRSEGAEALEPVVRHLIEINSSDSWSHRELANVLADLRRYDEALAEAALARDLEPNNPYVCCTAGRVLALAGRADEAREEYRKAIRLSVDVSYAIGSLVDLCQTHAERKEALRFVEHELIHQVVFGDGLLRFRELAHPVLEPEELLASLRVAMRERPDLWHAHSALVQQLTEMGRLEEALLAAREATARFPLLPRIWLDLARIHQARNHGTAEIEALEKALQINPSWSEAARQLANAHLRQGDLTQARQMLEKAVALEPLDVINHASLADLLWQTDQRDAALEEIRRAILINPGYDRPWRSFRDWTNQLSKPELAVDVARGLIERRPGDTLSWLRLAEVLSAPDELPERLNALDKAIALNPRCDSAWDLRAISLARAHRWEEALAACKPPAWAQPPLLLRARAAWIERQRGNQTEALAQMRAVLKENPDSYFCWRELADWQWEAGNYADAREAATMLTRLAPFDPIPFGYSGDIKARTGDKVGAKADFRRALELDPKYTYAGFSLFDLQLEEDDLRGAAETLDILRKQSVTEWVRSRDAQLLLRKGDCPAALAILKELCLDPQADDRPLHFIFDKAVRAGWLRETEKALLETMSNPKAHPYTGGMLVECRRIRGKWGYQRELNKFVKIGKAGENAIVTYLSVLGEAIDHDRSRRHILSRARLAGGAMSRIIRRHSEWLRKDDWAWGKTGYALFCAAKTTEGVKWLADWRERPQAQPWMLVNYIAMLHRRGHDAEANEVVQHVLSRPDQDNIPARFPILGAIEAGLNGHAELLNRLLSEVRSDQLSEFDKRLVEIPRLLQEFSATKPPTFGKPHRQRLSKFLSTHQWNNKSLLRVYYRAARFISQRTGSRWPIVWAYCRHYGPIVGGIAAFAIVLFLRWLARLYPPALVIGFLPCLRLLQF